MPLQLAPCVHHGPGMGTTIGAFNTNETRTVDFGDGDVRTFPASVYLTDDPDADPDPREMHFNYANFRAFAGLLGLPIDEALCGELPISDVRRAIMRARATFDRRAAAFTRDEERTFGAPRRNEDGSIELHPLRSFAGGLTVDRLADHLDRFAVLVEAYAERGATHVRWC